jgi:signal transduction histidine kinase
LPKQQFDENTVDEISECLDRLENEIEIMQAQNLMTENLMLDLLDLAQLESTTLKFNEDIFNLHTVIKDSFDVVKY